MPKRWNNNAFSVPAGVVKRIYEAVKLAQKQELHGGFAVDLVERAVGRKLRGEEYTVAKEAREHLGYNPPGGYQGPTPTGAAAEPMREHDSAKASKALQLASNADRIISGCIKRYAQWAKLGWDRPKEHDLLRGAADDLEVAADLFEEAGPRFLLRAGTLRERAKLARSGNLEALQYYET